MFVDIMLNQCLSLQVIYRDLIMNLLKEYSLGLKMQFPEVNT